MPVELDFWAESLNKQYRPSNDINDYATNNYQQKLARKTFSIFESE